MPAAENVAVDAGVHGVASALLLTVEAPEARYTLECFPMLFVLGGVALYRLMNWVLLSVLKVKASEGRD